MKMRGPRPAVAAPMSAAATSRRSTDGARAENTGAERDQPGRLMRRSNRNNPTMRPARPATMLRGLSDALLPRTPRHDLQVHRLGIAGRVEVLELGDLRISTGQVKSAGGFIERTRRGFDVYARPPQGGDCLLALLQELRTQTLAAVPAADNDPVEVIA